MKDKISIISFAAEKINYFFNNNEKYHRWIEQPEYLQLYNEVPEHSSAINFILNNLIIDAIKEIDYWTLQKLALDYLIYGGFTMEVQKTRGGGYILNYVDIGKCRFNPTKTKVGYSENWTAQKVEIEWMDVVDSVNKAGIYYFKNNKSRNLYPTPHYYSAVKSLNTMNCIIDYHNNNAKSGFTPNVIINFNNGEPDTETKKEIEKKLQDKFTGVNGQKFILSFNESVDTATTIETINASNLDEKFETLQKFIQNQIIISHQITSGQLIGVKAENQGFSAVEYNESMEIFMDSVVSTFRKELNYALSKMLNTTIDLPVKEIKIQKEV
jgi:hypothetical protein